VGDLDAESLFYLRARGIPEAEARGVLIRAFLEEALMDIRGGMRAEHFQATEAALGKLS
jgi:Fe-S cluster assembly protein SufD